jgi:hypothetical protein
MISDRDTELGLLIVDVSDVLLSKLFCVVSVSDVNVLCDEKSLCDDVLISDKVDV